jgi:hypothetical protein
MRSPSLWDGWRLSTQTDLAWERLTTPPKTRWRGASEQGGASAAGEMERELLGQAMKKQQEQKIG